MEKIKVAYEGGQSKYSEKAVDYMLAEVDGVKLYAESEEIDKSYEELKQEILDQAIENDIDIKRLKFYYDKD